MNHPASSPVRAVAAVQPRKPRPGDLLEVEVEALERRGGAVGRADHPSGAVRVELPRGVPGERVRARVLRRRGGRVQARSEALLRASPLATAPRCAHFGACGGCSHQDLAYAAQLEHGLRDVEAVLREAGLLEDARIDPVQGCEPPWNYRNKMEFSFGARRWVAPDEPAGAEAGFALGLHPQGLYGKVLDVRRCEIAFEGASAILASARALARERGLEPWDVRAHAGLLRHLVLRRSEASGEVLANLVTSALADERVRPYAEALLARHPEITTLVQTVNSGPAQVATGELERVLHGEGAITETLRGVRFRLSATSFFQTNTRAAEHLLAAVEEEAALERRDVLHDLYCGAGAIALALARGCREVWGFELHPGAVQDARANAERNRIGSAHFFEGDVATTVAASGAPAPDVVVVDPPRAGLHPRALGALGGTAARRVVYVSCNLRSAARDAASLRRRGFALARVRPFDLFPHTPHLECVLTLERRG